MTVEEAVLFGDFLQRCTLHLSMRPRTASGKLINMQDQLEARDLYKMVDEHEKVCQRLMNE